MGLLQMEIFATAPYMETMLAILSAVNVAGIHFASVI